MDRSDYKIRLYHPEYLIIEDLNLGGRSVTNDVENVVSELLELLGGRKLYYIDSMGNMDQILIRHDRFDGFKPGGPP